MRLAIGLLSVLLAVAQLSPVSAAGLADSAIAGVVASRCSPNAQDAPPADSATGQLHDAAMKYALQHEMQRQLGEERQRQLNGDSSGAGMAGVIALMDCANRLLLDRMLEASSRNCDFARETGLPTAFGLERQTQLLGGSSGINVVAGANAALENCWKEATKECIEPEDSERMANAVGIARQGQLLGGDENTYSLDAISVCSTRSLPSAASRQVVDAVRAVGNWLGIGGGSP